MSSGLPEISSLEDVQYVRDALLPGKSDSEATYAFTKYATYHECIICTNIPAYSEVREPS